MAPALRIAEQWEGIVVAGDLRKMQSVADKYLPSSVKDLRVDLIARKSGVRLLLAAGP